MIRAQKPRSKTISCNGQVSLHKILFHLKALLWESFILLLPPSTAKPTLWHTYCTTIAQYTPPHRPLLFTPYTIQYWRWQYRVKANPQDCLARPCDCGRGDSGAPAQRWRRFTTNSQTDPASQPPSTSIPERMDSPPRCPAHSASGPLLSPTLVERCCEVRRKGLTRVVV